MSNNKKKIAILGGGLGGLTTAWYLSNSDALCDNFDITVYQMGWRLGGKCSTGRGEHGRIEEHGLHGFLGSYYNALIMMKECYEELATRKIREPGDPLSSFEDAFLADDTVLRFSYSRMDKQEDIYLRHFFKHLVTLKTNQFDIMNVCSDEMKSYVTQLNKHFFDNIISDSGVQALKETRSVLKIFIADIEQLLESSDRKSLLDYALSERLVEFLEKHRFFNQPYSVFFPSIKKSYEELKSVALDIEKEKINSSFDEYKKLLFSTLIFIESIAIAKESIEYSMVLIKKFRQLYDSSSISENSIQSKLDSYNNENFSYLFDLTARGELQYSTLTHTLKLSFQHPDGDSTIAPVMAAGAYLLWTIKALFLYMGHYAYFFSAGTGDTIVAPLYQVLEKRGVKFKFFHRVRALELDEGKKSIKSVHFNVQAALKNQAPLDQYYPLKTVKNIPSWPNQPLFEQLEGGLEGGLEEDLEDKNFESYWDDTKVAEVSIEKDKDFDYVVNAIAIGAQPIIAQELIHTNSQWQQMVQEVKTVPTQAMQLWLTKSWQELGGIKPPGKNNIAVSASFFNPQSSFADFSHMITHEAWPQAEKPNCLIHICGPLVSGGIDNFLNYDFSENKDYPSKMHEAVREQSIQYLQNALGTLLPQSTMLASSRSNLYSKDITSSLSLDFQLLYDVNDLGKNKQDRLKGVNRFDSQYFRANIGPSERYTVCPPGSIAYRLKVDESGFDNLLLAGDWVDNGLYVGSFEGAVMGGKLASNTIIQRVLGTDSKEQSAVYGYVLDEQRIIDAAF